MDIKGFFDNISHGIMMQLLRQHTQEKWVLMYAERWLKAGVEQEDGSILARTKGTPQGGVASPLFSNIYLHHLFDKWMDDSHPKNPFERYADDIVIHCRSKEEADQLLKELGARMQMFELAFHDEKTKIVYCKNYLRTGKHDVESFTFLSYSFQPRRKGADSGSKKTSIIFAPAISSKAKTSIREAIRAILILRWTDQTMEGFAKILNPKIRGWVNYYTRFYRQEMLKVFCYLNERIRKWLKNKYKLTNNKQVVTKYKTIQKEQPALFYHWLPGVKT